MMPVSAENLATSGLLLATVFGSALFVTSDRRKRLRDFISSWPAGNPVSPVGARLVVLAYAQGRDAADDPGRNNLRRRISDELGVYYFE